MPLYCCLSLSGGDATRASSLQAVARACSPRVEPITERAVIFDASGLDRAVGPPPVIAREVARLAAADGMVDLAVAVARSVTSAWLLAQACTGITVAVASPADALAILPVRWLETLADLDGRQTAARRWLSRAYADGCAILARWGLHSLGDLARLDRADVHARLGASGVRLHQAARGEDTGPLGPVPEQPAFVERLELEWPIDSLEPLAFVLARQTEALCAALARADRGAAVVTSTFGLVTRDRHVRVLQLPTPIGDPAVLRTLVLLDLEAHPPPAAIDTVELAVDPAPRRIEQRPLLDRVGTSPEDQATLLARLGALMGETRVGRPVVLDIDDARAVGMEPWMPGIHLRASRSGGQALEPSFALRVTEGRPSNPGTLEPSPAVRRFRVPVAASVTVSKGVPLHVRPSAGGLPGGDVIARAGPWRTSGRWWRGDRTAWDRDEWDLELTGGVVYRLARDRTSDVWVIEGILD